MLVLFLFIYINSNAQPWTNDNSILLDLTEDADAFEQALIEAIDTGLPLVLTNPVGCYLAPYGYNNITRISRLGLTIIGDSTPKPCIK